MDYLAGWNPMDIASRVRAIDRNPLYGSFIKELRQVIVQNLGKEQLRPFFLNPALGIFIMMRYFVCLVLNGNRDSESSTALAALTELL